MRQQLAQLGGGAHALAIQILGNPDDAADAVHDAFATVLAKPEVFNDKRGPLRPWFLTVVRNRCLDMLRRRRGGDVPVEQLVEPSSGPEEILEKADTANAIQRALASIDSEKRQIVVLRDYLDLSYAEIADILSIAPGTVMSRLHRARLVLKEALQNHER
jgi:RNA polymerase sigma-70 factor (ECF subfamily)